MVDVYHDDEPEGHRRILRTSSHVIDLRTSNRPRNAATHEDSANLTRDLHFAIFILAIPKPGLDAILEGRKSPRHEYHRDSLPEQSATDTAARPDNTQRFAG